jgi:hypothetical protein
MPVDLTCIPPRAKRQSAPSFKRWVILLVVLIVAGAGITALFWPMNSPLIRLLSGFVFLESPWLPVGLHLRFAGCFILQEMAGRWLGCGQGVGSCSGYSVRPA